MIPLIRLLEPYFKIAEQEAKKSPCLRRKYGAVIAYEGNDIAHEVAHNIRIGKCCEDNICARDRFKIRHGGNIEIGGELHAEIAVLIRNGYRTADNVHFLLAGFDRHGIALYDHQLYPCHACALAIKYAGWKHIYLRHESGEIFPKSIAEIIIEREEEWESDT